MRKSPTGDPMQPAAAAVARWPSVGQLPVDGSSACLVRQSLTSSGRGARPVLDGPWRLSRNATSGPMPLIKVPPRCRRPRRVGSRSLPRSPSEWPGGYGSGRPCRRGGGSTHSAYAESAARWYETMSRRRSNVWIASMRAPSTANGPQHGGVVASGEASRVVDATTGGGALARP